jgi:hypothetical protein
MARLNGYGAATYIRPSDGAIGVGGPVVASASPTMSIVDGTPIRVVVLALAAAAGLTALKMAGIRFNIGVST